MSKEQETSTNEKLSKERAPIWKTVDELKVQIEEINKSLNELSVSISNIKSPIWNNGYRLEMLEDAVESIKEKLNTPQNPTLEFKAPDAKPSEYKPKGYIPAKYRQIVDEILSSEFGLECEESPVNMDFTISIVVPTRYSSLTAQEKEAGMLDIRSKVISRALGENGVRDWCNKVRENLNKFYTASGVVSPFTKA